MFNTLSFTIKSNKMRALFITLLCIQNILLFAQTNIYTNITAPNTLTSNNTDEFEIDDATGFNVGDKVLIIQVQGAEISTTDNSSYGNITNITNAGNYEFAYICQISGTMITLTSPLLNNYDVAGKVQMINVPQYQNHSINSTLNASQSWNGDTGGVLVFEVNGVLTLNADIDLTGQGFRGGEISDNNTFCTSSAPPATISITNYVSNDPSLAGGKGEGVRIASMDNRARGKNANGGGGGNTFEGGGGGGANAGAGGLGGFGKNSTFVLVFCTGVNSASSNPNKQGIGGLSLSTYFSSDKIFLGGGGGGGQATNGSLGAFATKDAGRGGGIIIIRAKEIVANGHKIIANGENVLPNPFSTAGSDGNSGAGAGGSVLLDVTTYTGMLDLEAKGGNGGNTSSGDGNHYGPGGGGGGGLIWVSNAMLPSAITNVNIDISGGTAGISNNGSINNNFGATAGTAGVELNNLIIPENGGVPLAGIYTVGGTNPDFVDLETAINQINIAGINADVTFNLRNGTYTESTDNAHTLDNYKVCSSSPVTLTIQSESANANDVIIQTSSATSKALSLKNIDNIILNNLTLENTQAVISAPDSFNDAFLAENVEVDMQNIKVIGNFEVIGASNVNLTGNNIIESGNLLLAATLNNNGTLTVGSDEGGNIRFQANANLVNVGNNRINFQGRTWIEDENSALFTANMGTVVFSGNTITQEIQGGTNTNTFYNIEIDNTQGVRLQSNISLENNLILTNGIFNTSTNEIIFTSNYPEANTPNESNTAYILGLARMENKSVGTGTLNFLGVNIAGSDDIGNVNILRNTGTSAIQTLANGASSIASTWNINVGQQPSSNRILTFTWLEIFDNANDVQNITFWRRENNTWLSLQEDLETNTNPRQVSVSITEFSEFTFGTQNVDLLSFLEDFDGTKIDIQNNNLFWKLSEVSNLAELVLEKSANNIDFTSIANITDLSNENFIDNEGLGSFYYRLKLVGSNNFEVYSDTIFLEELDRNFALIPNPFQEVMSIQSTFPRDIQVSFKLTNLRGQEILDIEGTLEDIDIYLQNFAKTLPKAMYISETMIDGSIYVQKIIKQ